MWNDTDIPLAYLFTFRTFGTWLHGDERGSVDRLHNQHKSPYLPPDRNRVAHNLELLSHDIVTLDGRQRRFVKSAIRETCRIRAWALCAVNVRTNHVHAVISIGATGSGRALNDLKAYATRRIRHEGCWSSQRSPWADKGSKRPLWNERSVEMAVDYVLNRQGAALPDFD